MKKIIAIITIALVISLVACAPKKSGQEGTPTPDNKDNTQATATPSAGPGDPDFSIDLEEDVLGEGDQTAEATGTAQTDPTSTQTPTNVKSPEVTGSEAPVATATPVVTATPQPTEQPIISLPMDFF